MIKIYTQLCQNSSLPPPAAFQCEDWTVGQVGEWLKGVDDGISALSGHFCALGIDGRKLVNVDSDTLKRMGVSKETTRGKIMAAINLLLYYSYSIKYENLQRLAMKTSLSSNELLNAVSLATPVINSSPNVSKHIEMLNGVLRNLADTYETAIGLIFWLQRNPFVGNKKFAKFRNNLSALVDEMVDCVNNPNNPKFFSVPQVLVERAHSIRKMCQEIIHMEDPSVLYTAFLERITIRKPPSSDWGFDVGHTCLGVNLITCVDYNSMAAFSDKFDVGDEILEIDGTAVVGWKLSTLLRKLNEQLRQGQQFPGLPGNVELQLLLCKRPRESGSPQRPPKQPTENSGEQENKQLSKMAWDFKNKIGTDCSKKWQRRHRRVVQPGGGEDSDHSALRRARSSSFTANSDSGSRRCSECSLPRGNRCISLLLPTGRQPLFRRASVWNESPPATLRSPFEGFHSESNSWLLLLASWGQENRSKIDEKRPERQQRPPLECGTPPLLGEAVPDIRLPTDPAVSIVFSSVELVPEGELLRIGTSPAAAILGAEWMAPVREITGLQVHMHRLVYLDSGNEPASALVIDSPLSNIHAKIARFFYGGDVPAPAPPAPLPAQAQAEPMAPGAKPVPVRQLAGPSECRTPLTPNSKFSLDLPPLSAASSKPGGEESSSSLCSVDSPSSSFSSSALLVKTVTRSRLAPLAEPDDVGDLTTAYLPGEEAKGEERHTWTGAGEGEGLPGLFGTSAQSQQGKGLVEGLIRRELLPMERERRRKQPFHTSFRRKRWTSCWATVGREAKLFVYPSQTSEEPDLVVHLPGCTLARKAEFRTGKKHVFVLKSKGQGLHFSTYSAEELDNWVGKIEQISGQNANGRAQKSSGPAIFIRKGPAAPSPGALCSSSSGTANPATAGQAVQ